MEGPKMNNKAQALADLEILKKAWDEDRIDVSGRFVRDHYETVKAALQSDESIAKLLEKSETFRVWSPQKDQVCIQVEWDGFVSCAPNLDAAIKEAIGKI
jgi:hypothetical protein